jgi:hypothetical protein
MTTNPRRVMYAFGFQFILMALRIQLSGVTREVFNSYRRTSLFTWFVLIAHIISVKTTGHGFMDEPLMYLILDVVSGLSLAHFIWNVQLELKTILGINLLSLTKEQMERQKHLI